MWNYFTEVRAELRHVTWPSRRAVITYTAVVVGVSLAVAVYLGLLDYLFAAIVEHSI